MERLARTRGHPPNAQEDTAAMEARETATRQDTGITATTAAQGTTATPLTTINAPRTTG